MIPTRPRRPAAPRLAPAVARLTCCAAACLALAAPAAAPLGAQPPRLAMPPRAALPPLDAGGGQVGRAIGRVVGRLVSPVVGRVARDAALRVAPPRDAAPFAAAAGGPADADDPMRHDEAFRAAADAFAAAAARGDGAAVDSLLAPALRARADSAGGLAWPRSEVLAFFAERPTLGGPTTVAERTDERGNRGLAYYLYALPRDGGAARPVVLAVVRADGHPRLAAVLVDHLVVGRHR